MNQKIIFTNKTHGKINMSMIDLIAWRKYTDVEELPQQPEIINLHPQPNVEVLKKGRGRPKKIIQVVPVPEPEPEPIHQHPPPVFTSKGSDQGAPVFTSKGSDQREPEPELKRGVGRPKKILFIGHGC